MEKIVRSLGFLILFFGLNSTVIAGNFKSIYSVASSSIPTSSGIVLLGGSFKNMYAPTGVSGCSIGIPELSSFCVNSGSSAYGGLSFGFNGYSYPTDLNEIKIYLPPGTLRFSLVASLPQSTIAAAALRIDAVPTRIAPLSSAEYSSYQATAQDDVLLKQLLAGNEVIRTHDGGGTYAIAGGYVNGMNFKEATTVGHWLYIRFINPVDLYQVMGSVMVNNTAYQAGYSSIQWDANGDPVDTASGGTTTSPTSFSITPNPATLIQGVPSTIAITPSSGFTLKNCSASPEAGTVSYANNSITLTPNSTNPVTITCTSTTDATAEARLQVQPAPTTAFSSFTLSPPSLLSTDTVTPITVLPNPGAVAPICNVNQSKDYLITTASNTWAINPNFNLQQIDQSIAISCGSDTSGNPITSSFKINLPLAITRSTRKDGARDVIDLNFQLPSTIATNPVDVYVFVYAPDVTIDPFNKIKNDFYGYQANDQWDTIAFGIYSANQKNVAPGSSITIKTGLIQAEVDAFKPELYVAYTPAGSRSFTFIGNNKWSKISSSPTSPMSSIPVFWNGK